MVQVRGGVGWAWRPCIDHKNGWRRGGEGELAPARAARGRRDRVNPALGRAEDFRRRRINGGSQPVRLRLADPPFQAIRTLHWEVFRYLPTSASPPSAVAPMRRRLFLERPPCSFRRSPSSRNLPIIFAGSSSALSGSSWCPDANSSSRSTPASEALRRAWGRLGDSITIHAGSAAIRMAVG
jgi:hypothetical protein